MIYSIRDCTSQMLIDIRYAYNREKRTSDKELAQLLEITPASFSRLYNKVTRPSMKTWRKLSNLHAKCMGKERNTELINRVNYD